MQHVSPKRLLCVDHRAMPQTVAISAIDARTAVVEDLSFFTATSSAVVRLCRPTVRVTVSPSPSSTVPHTTSCSANCEPFLSDPSTVIREFQNGVACFVFRICMGKGLALSGKEARKLSRGHVFKKE